MPQVHLFSCKDEKVQLLLNLQTAHGLLAVNAGEPGVSG